MNGASPMSKPRAGMTLVEVLAVCVIIGILAAMAFPALARAIARSRLTICTNNQYQIASALLRHDEQFGYIPGWLNEISVPIPSGTIAMSWPVPLLPFLGRSDIYDMIFDSLNSNSWPRPGLPTGLPNDTRIEGFVCPANRVAPTTQFPLQYVANVGASGTQSNDGVFLRVFAPTPQMRSLADIADADGTAMTLAFTEKAAVGIDPHVWTYWTAPDGAPDSVVFPASRAPPTAGLPPVFGVGEYPGSANIPVSPPVIVNNSDFRHFSPSSVHPGGAVVAFCDGHTGFLSDKLQPYEYGQLLTVKSRWRGARNITNSVSMWPWLLRSGTAYLLDEKILRQ